MKKKSCGYYVNRHSCFLLQYHLVLVTKFKHPVIKGKLDKALQLYTEKYFSEHGCVLLEVNSAKDHMHILFEAPPQINLANFVNAFKSASSRRMRADFADELSLFYWKPYFWSLSYFISTVSDRTADAVANYIKNQ